MKLVAGLLLSLSLLLPAGAAAGTWTDLDQPVVGTALEAARQLVKARARAFGFAGGTLQPLPPLRLPGGEVVRLVQQLEGRPVLDARLSVLIQQGRIIAASGQLQNLEGGSLGTQLSAAQAIQRLRPVLPAARVRSARLAYRAVAGRGLPVWVLEAISLRPLRIWRSLIDGRDGQVLQTTSALRSAKGTVYAQNPVVSSLGPAPLQGLLEAQSLSGEHADVFSCAFTQTDIDCLRRALPDAAGDYLFQPEEPSVTDPFSEVQAYYHIDSFHRWLTDRFGFVRASQKPIAAMVNLHYAGSMQGMPNAFFGDIDGDGRGDLGFGQGSRDYAYDGDVVYHEFAHAVISETSDLDARIDGLGFNAMPLGLNEGFADLMSSAFTGDGSVGEYAGEGGIRDLTGAASCPDQLTGESHDDGLVWGTACWAVRGQLKEKEVWDEIVYKTMVSLGKYASFAEATALLLKIAQTTSPALAKIAQAELSARGLTDCTRLVPLQPGVPRSGILLGADDMPGLSVIPAGMQYRIDAPARASKLSIELIGSNKVSTYVRRGETVAFASSGSTRDFTITRLQRKVILTPDSENEAHRLVPGSSYYLLPISQSYWGGEYKLRVELELDPTPLPDAAPALPDAGALAPDAGPAAPDAAAVSAEPPAQGCGCNLGGSASGWTGLLLALALLALLRRRGRWRRLRGRA